MHTHISLCAIFKKSFCATFLYQSIGYKPWYIYYHGPISLDTALEDVIRGDVVGYQTVITRLVYPKCPFLNCISWNYYTISTLSEPRYLLNFKGTNWKKVKLTAF